MVPDETMQRDKIEKALRAAITQRDAKSIADRSRVYADACRLVDRSAMPGRRKLVEDAICQVESSYSDHSGSNRQRAATFATRPLVLLGLSVALAFGILGKSHVLGNQSPNVETASRLAQAYHRTSVHLPAAEAFIKEVLTDIQRLQKANDKRLRLTSKSFVRLATFNSELSQKMPSGLPVGTSVVVRADEQNVKVLMDGPLCAVAQVEKPLLVDPVRSSMETLGCPYFGIWTDGAAVW